ncbi:MAG: tetratricopeptide repeat protein [Zoogloeaceae bacterium]|nr:tetratricopeptide repeat protein [Zoogloeaceae bacterium]
MKLINSAALAAVIALSFSAPGWAAENKAKAPLPDGNAAKVPSKATSRGTAAKEKADAAPSSMGQVVYQVLLGEIALQRGNISLAVSAYADLAYRTKDPKVLQRTIELASAAQQADVAYGAAKLWVETEPESQSARQMLAAVLIMQGRADELGPQITVLLEQDKANLGENLMRLNRMLARFPDKVALYHVLEKVLAPYAGIAESHFALATAALHAGDRLSALQEIRKALVLRPNWEIAALFTAQVLARDSASSALEYLEQFLEAHPEAKEVRLHLARGLVAEKRYTDARRHFDRLLADSPDDTALIYPVAILALQQNDVKSAEPALRLVFERGEPSEKNVAAYYLGQITEGRKAYGESVRFYQQVGPGDQFAAAQIRVGKLLILQGADLAVAQAHLQASAKRYPLVQPQMVIAEAQLLRDAGKNLEALTLLEQVLARQPDQADILYDAALLAERLGRMDVLETNLRRVIELRSDNAHAYNALGYSFADRGIRLDEARQLLARASALAPDDPFIMDSMGWVLFKQGDLNGALGFLQKAYALRPDAEIAAHLGEVLWQLGKREDAIRVWGEASARHPESEELRAVRKKFQP